MSKRDATMPARSFQARCLQLMEQVSRTRRPITITKRGRPVARLIPVDQEAEPFLDSLRDWITITGENRTSATAPEAWETEQE